MVPLLLGATVNASAGKGLMASSGSSSARDVAGPDLDVDFSNTPEGYFEMGKQLGIAFSTMYGSRR